MRKDSKYGLAFIAVSLGVLYILGTWYWNCHLTPSVKDGKEVWEFAFWKDGSKIYLEVIFWSLVGGLVKALYLAGYWMSRRQFERRYIPWYIATTAQAPVISLALLIIFLNLGVSLGDATLSFKSADVTVVISLSIILGYFSKNTYQGLNRISEWILHTVESRFKIKEEKAGKELPEKGDLNKSIKAVERAGKALEEAGGCLKGKDGLIAAAESLREASDAFPSGPLAKDYLRTLADSLAGAGSALEMEDWPGAKAQLEEAGVALSDLAAGLEALGTAAREGDAPPEIPSNLNASASHLRRSGELFNAATEAGALARLLPEIGDAFISSGRLIASTAASLAGIFAFLGICSDKCTCGSTRTTKAGKEKCLRVSCLIFFSRCEWVKGPKLGKKQIILGFDYAIADIIGGRNRALVIMDAADCDCEAACLLAMKQVTGSEWVSLVKAVGIAVIEGTLTALKPVTGAGKAAKKLFKEFLKKAKKSGATALSGSKKVTLKQKGGIKINKNCTVTWNIVYDKTTWEAKGTVECKCNGKTCAFLIEYEVNKHGFPDTAPKFTKLK